MDQPADEQLGFEDEVVIGYVESQLQQPGGGKVDPKQMQLYLTGFLEHNTPTFMKDLWALLISAQENELGVPTEFLERKKEEIRQKKEEQARAATAQARRSAWRAVPSPCLARRIGSPRRSRPSATRWSGKWPRWTRDGATERRRRKRAATEAGATRSARGGASPSATAGATTTTAIGTGTAAATTMTAIGTAAATTTTAATGTAAAITMTAIGTVGATTTTAIGTVTVSVTVTVTVTVTGGARATRTSSAGLRRLAPRRLAPRIERGAPAPEGLVRNASRRARNDCTLCCLPPAVRCTRPAHTTEPRWVGSG